MWEVNRLKDARFYEGLGEFILDSPGFWDTDKNNILQNLIPIHFKISGLTQDTNKSLTSYKLRVYPGEVYSASIFCKTFDYTLFDGSDPQVELLLTGYNEDCTSSVELMRIGKNKADFPAQDWFRLKLENIKIPSDIHFLELKATIKRNGNILFLYPCIEFGDKVTDLNIYNSNIGAYYNNIIYEGVTETDEIIKTENIAFDKINQETVRVQRNFYLLTCDEEGIGYYEHKLGISSNIKTESLEFRRQRILNRVSTIVPYSFPFLQVKLDSLLGAGNWDAYIDFENYTLYIEYAAINGLWSDEIKITIMNIKPCNMVFRSVPKVSHKISIAEDLKRIRTVFNYKLDGSWLVGQKSIAECINNCKLNGTWKLDGSLPISTYGTEEILKLATTSSVQQNLLNELAQFTLDDIYQAIISDGTTEVAITGLTKSRKDNIASIQYAVSTSANIDVITSIKLCKQDGTVLISSPVYVALETDTLVKHKIPLKEGV